MGADLILGVCSHPRNVGLGTPPAIEAALHTYAAGVSRGDLEEFFSFFALGGEESLDEAYQERPEAPLEDLAESQDDDPVATWGRRSLAGELVTAYQDAASSTLVTVLLLGGQHWWVAGGSSWGDEPEGCRALTMLDHSGVFDNQAFCSALDLSTAHIPQEVLEWAGQQYPWGKLLWPAIRDEPNPRYVAHKCGWIVFLGDQEHDKDAEPWLQPILELARRVSCRFINFDQDGEVCAYLPDHNAGTPLEQLAEVTHEPG